MFSAAIKSGATLAPTKDPQFNYVTLLLHGDGTNGAQNNTFIDSSTNNFTITRNGNTTQGTFTPYGSNWSNYFDGNGDYLTVPSNAAFNFNTGDFTVECWINLAGSQTDRQIIGSADPYFGNGGWNLVMISTGLNVDGNGNSQAAFNYSWQYGVWYHIAVSRTGSNLYAYVNGVSLGVNTITGNNTIRNSFNSTNGPVYVGCHPSYAAYGFNGYISNARIVTGTGLYPSGTTFTPSTTPLTAISGTSLLTCQSNRFIDNSTNAFALTVSGTPNVQRFSPFLPTTAYSTSVIGGSGYFDGTGDYLSAANTAALGFGTGDFTIEFSTYMTSPKSSADSGYIFDMRFGSGNTCYIWLEDNVAFTVSINGVSSSSTTPSTYLKQWVNWSIVRSSGTVKVYVNGVLNTTFASAGSIGNSGITIGCRYGVTEFFPGYITDFRVVKGTAVYTTTYTPPTTPLSAITNTSLLLSYTNAGILDNAMMDDLETVGNAQVSTSIKKFGTGSMYFDGTGDWLASPYVSGINDLAGNFTIEFWIYFNSQGSITDLVGTANNQAYLGSGKSGWIVGYRTATGVTFSYQSSSSWVFDTAFGLSDTSISTTTWTHIAIVRSGSTIKCYKNGVASATTITSSAALVSNTFGVYVGSGAGNQTLQLNGYIDDLRITNGYARYTTNFTVPSAAFPNQ